MLNNLLCCVNIWNIVCRIVIYNMYELNLVGILNTFFCEY
jgi:hypothetical protein